LGIDSAAHRAKAISKSRPTYLTSKSREEGIAWEKRRVKPRKIRIKKTEEVSTGLASSNHCLARWINSPASAG